MNAVKQLRHLLEEDRDISFEEHIKRIREAHDSGDYDKASRLLKPLNSHLCKKIVRKHSKVLPYTSYPRSH